MSKKTENIVLTMNQIPETNEVVITNPNMLPEHSTEGSIIVTKKSYKKLLKETRRGGIGCLGDKFGRPTQVVRTKGKKMIEVETDREIYCVTDYEHMYDKSKGLEYGDTWVGRFLEKKTGEGSSLTQSINEVDKVLSTIPPHTMLEFNTEEK
tara:strand:+ start:934 stop:1389 length:456 start_codon:yes stop_codon:yes gene_type:complete